MAGGQRERVDDGPHEELLTRHRPPGPNAKFPSRGRERLDQTEQPMKSAARCNPWSGLFEAFVFLESTALAELQHELLHEFGAHAGEGQAERGPEN